MRSAAAHRQLLLLQPVLCSYFENIGNSQKSKTIIRDPCERISTLEQFTRTACHISRWTVLMYKSSGAVQCFSLFGNDKGLHKIIILFVCIHYGSNHLKQSPVSRCNCDTRLMVAVAARMCSRALLLVLLTAFVSAADGDKLQVGQSMDIMSRYGYLGITMRVVARNESDTSWIFREPTYDVFANLDPLTVHPRRSAKSGSFNGEFHMEFCDNLRQLKQAYFRDFAFEGLDKPWQAFTTGWSSPETIARHMGINSSFVHGDYCYVLVRLSRFWDNVKLSRLPNNVNLQENMADEIEKIFVGDVASVLMFTRRVGTHYINSFVTGNSLYQVFVYHKPIYLRIRERLKTRGIKNLSPVELSNFFSPWYAEHIGQIQVASGNKTVKHWATNRLRVHYYIFSYTSLMKIHGDTKLLSDLNGLLQNEALLQLDLRSLTPVFKDPVKREWFNEILDNYLNLLEENS